MDSFDYIDSLNNSLNSIQSTSNSASQQDLEIWLNTEFGLLDALESQPLDSNCPNEPMCEQVWSQQRQQQIALQQVLAEPFFPLPMSERNMESMESITDILPVEHSASNQINTTNSARSSTTLVEKKKRKPTSTVLSPEEEEDKRRRNTEASARFRRKKKEQERLLLQSASIMVEKVNLLERRNAALELELQWLKNLFIERDGESRLQEIYSSVLIL